MAAPLPVRTAETHISWVLLLPDRALKVYKPVATDVLDHRTVEARRAGCAREVELNARLAPDVYRGVAELVLDGEVIEPVIVMRRMPDERRLTALLDGTEARSSIRQVARTIATFHAGIPPLDDDAAGRVASRAALRRRWAADLEGLRELIGTDARLDEIERRSRAYIDGRGRLFEERIATGMVRDGHGDLLADDIFCLDDGPRVLDCLAFSDELRYGDVLADVAFLTMDLQRLGHGDLGLAFLHDYAEFSGEHHPASLAHLHVAQRALVRAKVSASRLRSSGAIPGSEVDRLIDLVVDHLRRAEITVTLVGGLPGSGKSTVSRALAGETGAVVVSSDEVRRDLSLRDADQPAATAYGEASVASVYDELLDRARQLVEHGTSVVLDATWSSTSTRVRARTLAVDTSARIVERRCTAPLDVCRTRVAHREDAALSEATPSVVDHMAERTDPWPEATEFATDDHT